MLSTTGECRYPIRAALRSDPSEMPIVTVRHLRMTIRKRVLGNFLSVRMLFIEIRFTHESFATISSHASPLPLNCFR
jgi:hypothetical protein